MCLLFAHVAPRRHGRGQWRDDVRGGCGCCGWHAEGTGCRRLPRMACAGPAWSGALPVGRRLRGRGSPSRGWRVVGRLAQSRQVVFHFSSRAVRVAGFQMAEQVRLCLPARVARLRHHPRRRRHPRPALLKAQTSSDHQLRRDERIATGAPPPVRKFKDFLPNERWRTPGRGHAWRPVSHVRCESGTVYG